MKSAEYYRRLDEADAKVRRAELALFRRRNPFRVSKSTTSTLKGYVVAGVIYGRITMLRSQNGYMTSTTTKAATIFKTRANAQTAIDAYDARFSHSCKMNMRVIIAVGETEIYHG